MYSAKMRYELKREAEREDIECGIYTPPDDDADADQLMGEKPWLVPRCGLFGKPADEFWYWRQYG